MESNQKKYEIGFLTNSETGNEDIKKVLGNYKVEITEEGSLNRIKLSYPIKKETFAYFGYVQFVTLPADILKIKEELKFISSILRFIVLAKPVSAIKEEGEAESSVSEKAEEMVEVDDKPKKAVKAATELSNEELEKKLEEILN